MPVRSQSRHEYYTGVRLPAGFVITVYKHEARVVPLIVYRTGRLQR